MVEEGSISRQVKQHRTAIKRMLGRGMVLAGLAVAHSSQ